MVLQETPGLPAGSTPLVVRPPTFQKFARSIVKDERENSVLGREGESRDGL